MLRGELSRKRGILEAEIKKAGLKMNEKETKNPKNIHTPPYIVKIPSHVVEQVDSHTYPCQRINLTDTYKGAGYLNKNPS